MNGMYPNERILEIFGEQVKWPGLGPDGKFTNGSFADPLIKPSFIPAETLNLLIDNIQQVIAAAGLTPNNIEKDQLLRAMRALGTSGGGEETPGGVEIIPPHLGSSRNLALVVLGHEVRGPADVRAVVSAVSRTVKTGHSDNFFIAPGDSDYFGLASINIPAGSDTGGAFSATLAGINGHGRNLDFVLVAKNPYKDKNANTVDHVIFQSRNVLSTSAGFHYMNASNTSAGGFFESKGRQFIITQAKAGLSNSGIPLDDPSKCPLISRRVANAGSKATAANMITDVLFLLTEYEIFGTHTHSSPTYEAESTQSHFSAFYSSNTSRIKYSPDGIARDWWEASPRVIDTLGFCMVAANGSAITHGGSYMGGIAPAFAVE